MTAALWLLAGVAVGCGDAPSDSGGAPVAQLSVRPVLPAVLSGSAFEFAVDRGRLRMARLSGEQVLDSVFLFPADSSQLSLRVKVPILTRREVLDVALELRSGSRLLFAGNREVEVSDEVSVAPTIPLQYFGPGADMTSLRLSPRDSVIRPGETFTFGLEAFSATGPLPAYYAGWSTSDHVVASVNARGTLRAPSQRGSVIVRVVSPTGIKDSTRISFSPPPTTMAITAGDGQTSQAGLQLPILLAIRVLAADQQGVPGIKARFTSLSGGRVLDSLVITDAQGYAQTGGVLGPAAGTQFFEAIAPGLSGLTFTATAIAGPPSVVSVIGGNSQTGVVNRTLATPLTVQVTDGPGNSIGGVPLTWTVTGGDGTLSSSSSSTNLSGVGFADLTLGRIAGPQRVRVQIPSGAFAEFTATAVPDTPHSIRIVEGNNQTDLPGAQLRPFVVEAADSLGNVVVGAAVRWSQVEGGGTLTPSVSSTDKFGRAVSVYRLPPTPGLVHVVAELLTNGATVRFEVTATSP